MNTTRTGFPIDLDAILTIIGFVLAIIGFLPCLVLIVNLFPLHLVNKVERAWDQAVERVEVALANNVDFGAVDVLAELAALELRFIQLRLQANRSTTVFGQLNAIIVRGLSCKLYRLKRNIDALRRAIQIAIDDQVPVVAEPLHVVAAPGGVAFLPLPNVAGVGDLELDIADAHD